MNDKFYYKISAILNFSLMIYSINDFLSAVREKRTLSMVFTGISSICTLISGLLNVKLYKKAELEEDIEKYLVDVDEI